VALLGLLFAKMLGCAPQQAPLRDPAAPLGATTRYDAALFAGPWRVVASTAPELRGTLVVSPAPGGVTFEGALRGAYIAEAQGVLRDANGRRLVVMWVDETFRTAALGAADGSFAALIAREPVVPADKRAAAFEIFDFYGWDVARIEERS
jgi:apolipoprotein D and lipocalin family protein